MNQDLRPPVIRVPGQTTPTETCSEWRRTHMTRHQKIRVLITVEPGASPDDPDVATRVWEATDLEAARHGVRAGTPRYDGIHLGSIADNQLAEAADLDCHGFIAHRYVADII